MIGAADDVEQQGAWQEAAARMKQALHETCQTPHFPLTLGALDIKHSCLAD